MLGKFVLTVLVIIVAVLVLKQRSQSSSDDETGKNRNIAQAGSDSSNKSEASTDLRVAAYMFLILMVGAAVILYYLRWQDDHTILTVNLFSNGETVAVSYEVYKYQLESRSFTTTDGTVITIADSERMEIQGLE